MTAIDHKVAMLDAIEVAANTGNSEAARYRLALAQVHATALLAEQQRVSNRIMLETLVPWMDEAGRAQFIPLREVMPNETIDSIDEALGTFA